MSAAAITGAGATAASSPSGFGALGSEEFIRVMLSELSNQDPFEPQDSAALLEQLSSIRNIEGQLSLQESLENLVLQNQVAIAGGLIGKVVAGLDGLNQQVEGQVVSVRVRDGKATLELDNGKSLSMDRVTEIFNPQDGGAQQG